MRVHGLGIIGNGDQGLGMRVGFKDMVQGLGFLDEASGFRV